MFEYMYVGQSYYVFICTHIKVRASLDIACTGGVHMHSVYLPHNNNLTITNPATPVCSDK